MKLKLIILALAVFGLSPAVRGQGFPNKPIELVVSSSPGGGVDLVFRLIAEELAKNLKTQVNVVNQTADSEIKTVKDLVAQAQKKPGDLIVAVGPPGTSLTLEVELLKRAAKIDLTSLPFAGSAQAITNLLGGHVNFAMASDVAAQPHIKAGKLIGLAVDIESAVLPDVPTFAKQGYPQINLLASVAFMAPPGLPEGTAKIMTDTIRKTVQEPKLQENLRSRGYNVDLRITAADVNKLVKEEIDKYSRFTPEDLGWKAQ